jgi:probable F420-dependent oxidoreductase
MEFVFQFPMRAVNRWDECIAGHSLGELAAAAEESGFALVSTTDHPFPEQKWLAGGGHHAFDPFVSLAFMAAQTSRIRLLTMLVVSGYRNPYITAKAAGSLDNLSGGRLVLGLGSGYQRAEFDVVGASFPDRGPRLDSAITAMQAAWTGEIVDLDDPYFPAHGHVMQPRPAQDGGPPLWFGGNSDRALRRVAEVGDGWMPIEQGEAMAKVTRTPPLGLLELAEKVETLRKRRTELGRTGELSVSFAPTGARDIDANVDVVAAGLAGYAAAGATHVLVESRARSFDDSLRELELFGPIIAARGRS